MTNTAFVQSTFLSNPATLNNVTIFHEDRTFLSSYFLLQLETAVSSNVHLTDVEICCVAISTTELQESWNKTWGILAFACS